MSNKRMFAKDLKPGMELDPWDLDMGESSIIKLVEIIPRPGMKYDLVKITMKDGYVLDRVTSVATFTVLR